MTLRRSRVDAARPLRRLFAAATLAMAVVLASAAPATAQYGGTKGFVIDPPVINVGDRVSFLGTGCEDEPLVVFTVEPLDLTLTEIAPLPSGDFYVDELPIGLDPGVYPVTATCGATAMVAQLTVLAEGEGVDTNGDGIPDALAFTGSGPLVIKAGLVALSLGVIFVLASRRREEEDQASPAPV